MMMRQVRTDVLMVGYFPARGAIAELFGTIAAGLAGQVDVGVLAPDHLDPIAGAAADLRFSYSTSRPAGAMIGRGWRAHRAAAATRPTVTLLFTQHPLNAFAIGHLRRSELAFWWHEPIPRGQAGAMRRWVYGTHDRLVVPRCGRIVVAGESVLSSVPDEFRSRTKVVPFPLPTGVETPSDRFAGTPSDLVFFGKLEPYKGLDTLAEALTILDQRGRHPTLRVIGSGDVDAAAPRLVEFAGRHPGRIDFVQEYAPAADVAAGLHASKICVLPYHTAAGSSAIAITGSNRTPLVASDAGSFGDYLEDGRTARLVAPGDPGALADALEGLLASPDEGRRLGDALYGLQAERFSIAATSDMLRTALLG